MSAVLSPQGACALTRFFFRVAAVILLLLLATSTLDVQLLEEEHEDLKRTESFLLPQGRMLMDAEHILVARTASLKTLKEVVSKEDRLIGAVQRVCALIPL
jgi:hypothetical protein